MEMGQRVWLLVLAWGPKGRVVSTTRQMSKEKHVR